MTYSTRLDSPKASFNPFSQPMATSSPFFSLAAAASLEDEQDDGYTFDQNYQIASASSDG